MKITWFGHSALQINGGGANLLIDPFISENPKSDVPIETIEADYILLTHGHGDHYGDTTEIAKQTGATVIGNFEVVNFATEKEGCPNGHPMHIGGGFQFPFGHVKLTIAHHGSSMPDGSYGGSPAGLILTIEDKRIYHAGDTGLFFDMKLIGETGIDLAFLPIGDNFTMGPEDALRAVELLEPREIVPIHYNTWDLIAQNASEWSERVQKQTPSLVRVLEPGDSFDF